MVEHPRSAHGSAPAEEVESLENYGRSSVQGAHELTVLRDNLVEVSGSLERHSVMTVEAGLAESSALAGSAFLWKRHFAQVAGLKILAEEKASEVDNLLDPIHSSGFVEHFAVRKHSDMGYYSVPHKSYAGLELFGSWKCTVGILAGLMAEPGSWKCSARIFACLEYHVS